MAAGRQALPPASLPRLDDLAERQTALLALLPISLPLPLFPPIPPPLSPATATATAPHPRARPAATPVRANSAAPEPSSAYLKEMDRYKAQNCGSDTKHDRPLVK